MTTKSWQIIAIAMVSGALSGLLVIVGFEYWPNKSAEAQQALQPVSTKANRSSFDEDSGVSPSADQLENMANARASRGDGVPKMFSKPFVEASAIARPSVVFVRVESQNKRRRAPGHDFFFHFFQKPQSVSSFGSGVIMRENGYIVTNRHVVKGGDKLEVVLSDGKTTYPAQLVGSDPSTDLAVLKIEEEKLPAARFADSDELDIGEWVLAVGNPFNLSSTVTTGIVSAKGRNIDVVDNPFPIESFIQTDAAINPGNSGGALVNLKGELVGINTAILSETGSYAGYGFAIPSNIVRKVANDIIEYGLVQRAFIEAQLVELSERQMERKPMDGKPGLYVAHVSPDGNADEAGLRKGDRVVALNGTPLDRKSTFSEQLAYHSPGDRVSIKVERKDEFLSLNLILVNSEGNTGIVKLRQVSSSVLGANFHEISKIEKERYGTPYGVKVTNVRAGTMRKIGIEEGFIITNLNNQAAKTAEALVASLENGRGRIYLEGISPDGKRKVFSFYLY